MEFQMWGKLDESGRIVSVQSQCMGSELSPVPMSCSPSQSSFKTETGEKFVPYSTKKELDCKLDNKIDEMSLLIVQMGELTKRMKLQEKLISKYEEDEKRHCSEISRLRAENEELRSMVNKRKRNSSFSTSFETEQTTSPKAFDIQIDGILNTETDNDMHVLKDDHSSGSGSGSVIRKQACDNIDKKITTDFAEVDIQLPVDPHGYVVLPNCSPRLCQNEILEQKSSGHDEDIMFQTDMYVNFSFHKQSIQKMNVHVEEDTSGGETGSCQDTSETPDIPADGVDDPIGKLGDLCPSLDDQQSYVEIPEELVLPDVKLHERPKTFHDPNLRRPPMPLPDRPSLTRSKSGTSDAGSQSFKFRSHSLSERHSSPDLREEIVDDKLRTLFRNMKTTMEWNEARKLLMSKSYECTTERAEESLKAIVKETYHKCFKRLNTQGPTASNGILAVKMLNHLKRKNQHDEDILTLGFLEKCIHLMHTL